jgi:uncharacterized protein YggE
MRFPALAVLLWLTSIAAAQQSPPTLHTIKASGEATIRAQPDEAEISLGVETQAADAKTAVAQNAAQSNHMISVIRQALGNAGEIETREYAITPEYKYQPDKTPALVGYRADNTVSVRTHELALVGKILDMATAAGANKVQGIAFTLRNDEALRAQALSKAAQKARANAEAIASGLNLHVVRVLEAESEQTTPVRPLFARAQVMAGDVSTPIQSPAIEVSATVTVTLEVQ